MTKENQPVTKGDLTDLERKLEKKLDAFKDEIIRHFDVVAENLKVDVLGALNDAVEVQNDARRNHEQRIQRLEQRVGIVA